MQRWKIAEAGYPYFVTFSAVKWLPVFVTPEICDIVIESLRYCRENKNLRVHAYVIMPTHVHLILSAPGDLAAVIRDIKRHTSEKIAEAFSRTKDPPFINVFRFCGRDNRPPTEYKVWQPGSHPEQIITEPFFRQKVNYIHDNPARKRLVTDPMGWNYSSARILEGVGDGPLDVDWLEW